MKTIVKFKSLALWTWYNDLPSARLVDEYGDAFDTEFIKRLKYNDNDTPEVVELVDIHGTIYRKASGKKRGRPKKEQPSVE